MIPFHGIRFGPKGGFVMPLLLLLMILGMITGATLTTVAVNSTRNASTLGERVRTIQAAESGAAWLVNQFASGAIGWLGNGSYEGAELADVSPDLPVAKPGSPNHGANYWWAESMDFAGDTVTFILTGASDNGSSRRLEVEFVRGAPSAPRPFGTAVVGCNGVALQGSGRIDSYDSRLGAYNQATANANADVMTLSNTGDITLPGNTLIKGGVKAGRNITISGSSTIQGEIAAVNNVVFQGNPTCPTVPVHAGGTITKPGNWWCSGSNGFLFPNSSVDPPSGECDPLNVDNFVGAAVNDAAPDNVASFTNGNYNGWLANPVNHNSENVYFNPNLQIGSTNQVNFNSGVDEIYVNGNLSLGGSGVLRIRAPAAGTSPVVKLYVQGNINLAGGSRLIIEAGAALEVYVKGSVNIGGGLVNENTKPTLTYVDGGVSRVIPTFSIFSSYSGNNGVQIGGNVQVFASVYAPRTSVTVAGSGGLYGAVRGQTVTVTGAGGIHFDESLSDASIGTGEGSGGSRVALWREVS